MRYGYDVKFEYYYYSTESSAGPEWTRKLWNYSHDVIIHFYIKVHQWKSRVLLVMAHILKPPEFPIYTRSRHTIRWLESPLTITQAMLRYLLEPPYWDWGLIRNCMYHQLISSHSHQSKHSFCFGSSRSKSDPLIGYGQHFGQAVYTFCNIQNLILEGLSWVGETDTKPNEDCSAE